MVLHSPRQSQMVFIGPKGLNWSTIGKSYLKWFRWSKMIQDAPSGPKLCKIVQIVLYGPKLSKNMQHCQIIQNSPILSNMVHYGPKLHNMVLNGPTYSNIVEE